MRYLLIPALVLTLTGCPMDDDGVAQEYRINVTNLSNGQPLSPPGALLHDSKFSAWTVGAAASDELEQMAEGGDASTVLALQLNNPQYLGSTVLLPGNSTEFTLTEENHSQDHLTLVGMLVNTNDAFTGINGIDLGDMKSGDSQTVYTSVYDAGTEANSEIAGTIPGPADPGGEGYNTDRDDWTSVVTHHGGVVGQQDTHPGSVLTEAERFDGPVLRIEITAL